MRVWGREKVVIAGFMKLAAEEMKETMFRQRPMNRNISKHTKETGI